MFTARAEHYGQAQKQSLGLSMFAQREVPYKVRARAKPGST